MATTYPAIRFASGEEIAHSQVNRFAAVALDHCLQGFKAAFAEQPRA